MKQDLEADVGSSGAQQCLRGCCRSHWGAVIQQSSPREREHLVASVGVRQSTPRVDIAQSERVRGGGDDGLGLERSLLSPGSSCTKPEELVQHFLGVAFLSSPSLCFIIRDTS